MNRNIRNCKLLFTVVSILLSYNLAFGQTIYPPKNQSPNASAIDKYGETSVSLFTGTPDISIPIYTINYGKINLPITLRYNSASVKPAQQPSWVGSGWNVEFGGAITRSKHGKVDEWFVNNYDGPTPDALYTRAYYPFPTSSALYNASNPGSHYANLPNWASSSSLAFDFSTIALTDPYTGLILSAPSMDPEADEFSFNVLGHSGKFYYEGVNSGWKVVSDEDIKVELTDFLSPIEIAIGMDERINASGYNAAFHPTPSNSLQSRMFGGFILTMPDGTKFVFGNRKHPYKPTNSVVFYDVADAVEYSSPRGIATDPASQVADLVFEVNTWHLTKIIDPNGNEVTYHYKSTFPTTNKFYNVDKVQGIATNSGASITFESGADYNKYVLSEVMQWPVYMEKILTPNEIVKFSFSNDDHNRYSLQKLNYADFSGNANSTTELEAILLGKGVSSYDPNIYLNNIKWQKLDTITVTDNTFSVGMYQYQPVVTNKFSFSYNNTTSQRLMLGAFKRINKNGTEAFKYQFTYNGDFVTQSPSLHADGNFSDHWGYFNAKDLTTYGGVSPNNFTDVPLARAADPVVSTKELLTKIIYPTGGSTVFTWEANDYSKIVSLNRQSLDNYSYATHAPIGLSGNGSTGFGGGNRISEIKSYSADGILASQKNYYYKNGYSAGANLSTLASSGVLNGVPVYDFGFTGVPGQNGIYYFNGGGKYFFSSGNYGYTGQGSPVGYKEVVEVSLDGSYTKQLFTNYDADYNGVSHWDMPEMGFLGWITGMNYNYFPKSTLEIERGKLVASFEYKPDNTLLKKTHFTYRSDAARFSSYINLIEKRNELNAHTQYYSNGVQAVPNDRITFASARKVFTYSYTPAIKTTTVYDQNGANPVVETENYAYNNSSKLLISKNKVNSSGETISSSYQYPADVSGTTYSAMVNAHILAPVVKTSTVKQVGASQIPVSEITANYSNPSTGIYVPQNILVKNGINSGEVREEVLMFDPKGNPLEVRKPNGVKEVFIWGVNYSQVLARITGANYNDAIALVNQSILHTAGFLYNHNSDNILRAELNKIRTGLPNAFVTTYTYAIGIGITSETDPRGKTIYYQYDGLNRLTLIKDQDGKILKKVCYNYAGIPENCTFYGNAAKSQNFTRSCPPGNTGSTVTYTVPANTYYSAISQADADAQAQGDIDANGQAYANANGTCTPSPFNVNFQNNTSYPYTVVFTNTATSVVTTYTVNPSPSVQLLGQLPQGTYNINISSSYSSASVTLQYGTTTQTASSFAITNLSITSDISFTLSPASVSCSFSMFSGYVSPTNSIGHNGTAVSFYMAFYSPSVTMQPGISYQVATISTACRPSATRTINFTAGGRNWVITIIPAGIMSWQFTGGTAVSPNTTISTATLTYNL
ncbi:MAG: DUF5977 domain-containing protein [Ferruginibacter sp.]